MNITVIGRGRVGGGLAGRWERAGHTVTRLGRDGGAAVDADAVLVAVPSGLQNAALYDRIDEQPVLPSNIYVADDGVREAAEALSRDAGYEPVFAGGLEDAVELFGAIRRAGGGPYFHRFAKPGELAARVSKGERPNTKGE
jgi:hypothetical protein